MTIPKPPQGTQEAGKRLWRSVLEAFELHEHKLTLLRQAVRTADFCDQLQAVIDRDGLLLDDRAHPALVELRQQRILLARLLVAMRIPTGDEDAEQQPGARTQRRGIRGVYPGRVA